MIKMFQARQAIIPLVIAMLTLSSIAGANATHVTSGNDGTHSSGSHSSNPGHLWASVKADHSGSITSGGRFHDGCVFGNTTCYGAFSPSDWSLDIGGGGGGASKLYLDYAGWGTGASPAPDQNRSITIAARVATSGNFRSPAAPACAWQRFDVLATYYGTNGTLYSDVVIGYYWIAHVTNWVYAVGTKINANASYTNPYGSGTIFYINGVTIGTVYNGADTVGSPACSTGAHTHVEFYSTHAWGGEYEWHSPEGPDSYNGLYGISDHLHWGSGYYENTDAVTAGAHVLGFVGGGTTSFWMADNPYYSFH